MLLAIVDPCVWANRTIIAAMTVVDDAAVELARLLDRRNEHPESLAAIDDEIWQRFGRTSAVLVLDMCGFSRLTMRHGVE